MSEEKTVQEQFPEVVKLTEQQRQQEYSIHLKRLNEKLELIESNDSELIKLIEAVVAGVIWLKEQHDKEGSINVAYKKKKNIHGGAEAKINVSASYKEIIDEVDSEVLTRNFLSDTILIDEGDTRD